MKKSVLVRSLLDGAVSLHLRKYVPGRKTISGRFLIKHGKTKLKTMFFEKFLPKLPVVKAQEEEEELVDPQQVLRVKLNLPLHNYVCLL